MCLRFAVILVIAMQYAPRQKYNLFVPAPGCKFHRVSAANYTLQCPNWRLEDLLNLLLENGLISVMEDCLIKYYGWKISYNVSTHDGQTYT